LVFDGHVHAVDRVFYHGGDIGQRKTDGQFDLPRAKEGGLGALFFSIFVTEDYYPGRLETRQALRMLDCAVEQIRRNSASIEVAYNAEDIERIHRAGKIAAVLDIEGSFDLDGDPGVLREMYRLGMRSVQLSAHNWTSNYADSCCSPPKNHGLNDRGREFIKEMNRLGMVINVSHASDEAIAQAIDISTDPVIATHHGLRAINNIPRNMPDDLLKKLAAKGGVIGFQLGNEFHNKRAFDWRTAHAGKAFWDTSAILARGTQMSPAELDRIVAPQFPMVPADIPDDIRMTVDEWVGVVDRAIQLVGEDHVALGSDFDGGPPLPRGMRDVRDLPMITEAMLKRGYSEQRIQKFLGGNLLRVFGQITSKPAGRNLGVVGSNPYFPLTPGYQLSFKHGSETDTVTVLAETKRIDGVETRVVEDREMKNGQLVELTHDYYAIDSLSSDVYYFGEDVDVYKNGKVAGHEGAWRSGVNGAKYGLMMPGAPKPGHRFNQENAPRVAEDGAEIVSVSEKVATPAGTFDNCVHVLETSPMEKRMRDHKWYAPRVGLVKDGNMALVEYKQ
jgi:membrane dipeptidase